VDFRLEAATNRDLRTLIGRSEFREDLFYRLNAMTVEVPALSDRPEDIPELLAHFLQSLGKAGMRVSERALAFLQRYSWPGNVRELRNVVERAVSLAEKDVIDVEHLPYEVRSFETRCRRETSPDIQNLTDQLACYEKEVITEALRLAKGNMARTARNLGISRSTLYEKCRSLGI
jgi:transcriptional regulator with PAS, ATPase and Fis domain